MKTVIAIPTYNEVDNIIPICEAAWQVLPEAAILIIDDGSTDGTKEKIKVLRERYPQSFHVIERAGKQGLGTAYVAAFRWAISKAYDAVIQMDADFSHPVDQLKTLQAELMSSDLVIGSRYCLGGSVENWGLLRQFISRGGSLYARTILGLQIRDLTGGFNAWKCDALRKMNLDEVRSEGYSFQIELKYKASRLGVRIKESPITFRDRRAGHSKMSSRIFFEAILRVWQIRCSRV